MEHVEYGNVSFNVWDCGGQEKVRRGKEKEGEGGRSHEVKLTNPFFLPLYLSFSDSTIVASLL